MGYFLEQFLKKPVKSYFFFVLLNYLLHSFPQKKYCNGIVKSKSN
jgi:hypothetical protein